MFVYLSFTQSHLILNNLYDSGSHLLLAGGVVVLLLAPLPDLLPEEALV